MEIICGRGRSKAARAGSQRIAPRLSNRQVAIAVAALFLIVLILNYIPLLIGGKPTGDEGNPQLQEGLPWQAGNQSPQGGFTLPNRNNQMPSLPSYLQQPALPENFTMPESDNCTPLGNPTELLQLDTYYKVLYDGIPIYTRSKFQGFYGTTAVHSVKTTASYNGESVSTDARYVYGLDGKCQQVEYSQLYAGSGSQRTGCSSYPVWFVCSELANESIFVRNDSVTIGGRKHSVSVYRSGTMEVWVGNEIPILYRFYASGLAEDGTNKSISIELIDVGAS